MPSPAQSNWTRIDNIGIQFFELPEFASAAGEARVLKRYEIPAVGGGLGLDRGCGWEILALVRMRREVLKLSSAQVVRC